MNKKAFTLIELLIVVAIIAILAAIAVPNFLAFQTRAKVSRSMADMRGIATALEAYAVDHSDYPPNDGVYNVIPPQLTTPIMFISTNKLVDTFNENDIHPIHGELIRYYTYTKIVSEQEFLDLLASGGPSPPVEAIDSPSFNVGCESRYGKWRLVSNGPDRIYSMAGLGSAPPQLPTRLHQFWASPPFQ